MIINDSSLLSPQQLLYEAQAQDKSQLQPLAHLLCLEAHNIAQVSCVSS